jgi:hypothetical protein
VKEQAYLVERRVRPMALVGYVQDDPQLMLEASSRLRFASVGADVIPFVVPRRDGWADCGYAASRWVVDLYEWLVSANSVPKEHEHRIRGLLLGYGPDAIREHDERGSGRRFTLPGVEPGQPASR